MPSTSIFEKQSRSFKITLLDSKLDETFVIEAGSTMYWNKFTNSIFYTSIIKSIFAKKQL